MGDVGYFRGTSTEHDNRFSDKEKKLMKQMKFADSIATKVDMSKVKFEVLKPWISNRIMDLLGMEDDVLVESVFNQLQAENFPDGRRIQMNLTGFLNGRNARIFTGELWDLLISAQEQHSGIAVSILEAKKEEIKQRQFATEAVYEILKAAQSYYMLRVFEYEEEETFVLIDTDAGMDDALAILMCLRAHKCPNRKFNIVGIVCVNGNTTVDNVLDNVCRTIACAGMEDAKIPIFRGCETPVVLPYENSTPYHGVNGFGDVELPPIKMHVEPEHGVTAIIRLAHAYKGQLTILALGPLTNLGMAVRLDPSIKECIREIYGMGGNIEGVGNTTVSGEFNFVVDPEAAHITLSTYNCPIFIVPWEVCLKQGTRPLKWRLEVMGRLQTPASDLLNKIEAKNLVEPTELDGVVGWIPCDQIAAAALLDRSVIRKSAKLYCTVELHGNHTRGLMVVDYPSLLKKIPNVTIISEIASDVLEKIMIWGAGGPDYK